MKLVLTINNELEFNKIKDYASYIILEDDKLSNYRVGNYNTIDMINLCNKHNITPIIKLNALIHPNTLDTCKEKLLEYKEYNCLFLITDLGFSNIAKKLGLISRVIYNPETMITNSLDAKEYMDFGFDSLALSLEIPYNDVVTIINKINLKAYYQIFGYRLMFQSKRKLLSLYKEAYNLDFINEDIYIEEVSRTDKYKILENEKGTYIFRSYLISLLKEIKDTNLYYGFLDSFNINYDTYVEVVKIYFNYINNTINIDEAITKINNLDLNISEGFTYNDSLYVKEN